MLKFELKSDRIARETRERRHRDELERQKRIFDDKWRTIGIDVKALNIQVEEKKRREEEAEKESQAYNADLLQRNEAASILHERQLKERQEMEKAIVDFRLQYQQPQNQREFDLNDPAQIRKTEPSAAQMLLPGLGSDELWMKSQQQRQRQEFKEGLLQQKKEQEEERQKQKMEELQCEQSRRDMALRTMELQRLEMEKRKAAAIATKEYNQAKVAGKLLEESDEKEEFFLTTVGVPGLSPGRDRRAPPEDLQQICQFQRYQVEEKHRLEQEKKREEQLHHRSNMDAARRTLLLERQQARLNKQLRRHLDSFNVELAQAHREQRPDIERGMIDECFFSKFNKCSR